MAPKMFADVVRWSRGALGCKEALELLGRYLVRAVRDAGGYQASCQ